MQPDANATGLLDAAVDPQRYESGLETAERPDPIETDGMLRAMMPEGVRVLDVGAGTGSATLAVNRGKNNRLIVVEPDADRASACRARGLETHEGMLDQELAERIGSVDVIVFSDVLEHLPSPAGLLSLSHDMLSEGGLVLASVPNVAHWSIRRDLLLGRFEYQSHGLMDATHLRWFTVKSLTQLFERSGFEVLEFRHSAGAWLPGYKRAPLGWLPYRAKRKVVGAAVRVMPRLFGCQHIVKARKR